MKGTTISFIDEAVRADFSRVLDNDRETRVEFNFRGENSLILLTHKPIDLPARLWKIYYCLIVRGAVTHTQIS